MSARSASCPNCGAAVEFRWSGAVQTTCSFCHSILVRSDIDVRMVGQVADLPPDSSPIQIGTEGVYENTPFVVTGRIIYEWEQGSWNEWHVVYSDSRDGWLSDAQLEYDVSFAAAPGTPLPPPDQVRRGHRFHWNQRTYEVTSITRARYRGVEGELPFEYWDKRECEFADLRTAAGEFATIDFSENPPLLFTGRAIEFDDLHLRNLREFEGWAAAGSSSHA